jgi:hypothetical protein
MAYTAGFSVSVGDPTKASDVTTLAANDDYLKAAVDGKAALSGSTNNTVATVTGANALIGEADLTFAANKLTVFGTTGTGAATASVLNLSTRETTVVDADQLGRIEFQAPAETGSDAVLVAASIYAEADGTFSATVNATDLVLATAHDGAAAERVRITSQGEIGLAGANYGTDGQVLTSAGPNAAVAWEAIPPGTTLSGSTNNTIATVTGANALIGEANLTFDGSVLTVTGDTTISADLMIGLTSISTVGGVATYKSEIASSAGAQMLISEWGNDNVAGSLSFSKSRSASMAAGRVTVNGGDDIGKVTFYADDGGGIENKVVEILAEMDNTSGAGDLPGRLTFWTATDGSTTLVERMRIDSAGQVIISGAFNNAQGLKVTSTGTEAGIQLEANSTNGTLWQVLSVGASGGGGVGNFQLYNSTDASTAMTITPAGKISQTKSADGDSFLLTATSSGAPYGFNVFFSGASPDNNGSYFFYGRDDSAQRIFIYSDGDLQNHDNSYGGISDAKLKTDILDARNYWDDFKQIQFRKFKFLSDIEQYGDDADSRFGVIAQEIEAIFPSLIKECPDFEDREIDTGEVDENGAAIMVEERVDLGTTTKGVKYSILSQIGLKVVQELGTRLEAAEAKIAALESA